jgi:hypothetical protein
MVWCISKNHALGLYPSSNVFFKNYVSETGSSSGKKGVGGRGDGVTPTLWGPLVRASLNHWCHPSPPFYLKTEAEPVSET